MLPELLQAPDRPNNVSKHAHWLAGEGAGSWFNIEHMNDNYLVCRFSDTGSLECQGRFKTSTHFDITKSYKITFPSHCAKVTVVQNDEKIVFTPID